MKVALVYDYLREFGGGERVLLALHEIYPEAPVYVSFADNDFLAEHPELQKLEIRTSPLQKIPFISKLSKFFSFASPLLYERFDLSEFDVVISLGASWAKGVRTTENQLHISYIFTPPRFLYHYPRETDKRSLKVLKPFTTPLDFLLRIWDFNAAQRPDYLVAISNTAAARIKKHYRRESEVIYPPVETQKLNVKSQNYNSKVKSSKEEAGRFFLVVSRLSKYKNVNIIIEACNRLDLPLKIIGTGREEVRLKSLAGETVEFLGFVNDDTLAEYYRECLALIFAVSEEDFGIVPVEAMAVGTPVIALRSGGVTETVVEGKTGIFFDQPTVESLSVGLNSFKAPQFDRETIVQHAKSFSKEKFIKEFSDYVETKNKK